MAGLVEELSSRLPDQRLQLDADVIAAYSKDLSLIHI